MSPCLHRRRWAILTFLVLLVLGTSLHRLRAEPQPGRPPNILVILADDLGWGDLSSYGAKDLRTPNIDALVQRGMRFDRFYANCPVCSPTRASLLSGRYPELAGVPGVIRTHARDSWGWLSPTAILLPELLSRCGYDTALVGKWHLGLESPNTPTERGFRFFHGFLGDMMDDYWKHRRHGVNYMRKGREETDPPGHATDLFTDWAAAYLRERRGSDTPWFLYLAYNAPHTPIQPPADWLARVRQREPKIDAKRAQLVALIEHLDAGVGKVLETLRSTGMANETLVVFTSDNGGQLNVGANNGALRDGKQSVYEGGLRVPTAIAWPRRIAAGSRSGRLLLTMDLYPTLAAAAGVRVEHDIDGVDFLPTLLGKSPAVVPRDVFFSRREGGTRYGGKTIEAVRRGQWKLLQNSPFAPQELYDLEADPLEATDLSKKRPRIFRELAAALRAHIQRGGAVPWRRP